MQSCRVKISTLLLLFALQGATVVFLSGFYLNIMPCASGPSASKVHVLLLSSCRSGSSFLGQAFSQHPSVFYLMEPGWHVWKKLPSEELRMLSVLVRDLFHSLFRCDFSGLVAYLKEVHKVSNMFMWSHSRALCSPPACNLTQPAHLSNQSQCTLRCDAFGLQGAQNACTVHSHVVLKSVRIFELESIYPLLRDPKMDIRIVHLVRDPRAVFCSREQSSTSFVHDNAILLGHSKVPPGEVQLRSMQKICHSHVRINEQASRKPPDFLVGRYKMVRYEDIVRDPLGEVNAIYRFAGLEMTPRLADWIYRVTHGRGISSLKDAFLVTSRDAKHVSEAWRTTLAFPTVRRLQEACAGAMSLLGYRKVSSETEQKRLDLDLLLSPGWKDENKTAK